MCGRYAIELSDEEAQRQAPFMPEPFLQEIYEEEWRKYQGYDVRPSTRRIVIPMDASPRPRAMRWGWPNRWSPRDHINARWEDGNLKKTFKPALLTRRCIVPAMAYYEWDRDEKDRPKK